MLALKGLSDLGFQLCWAETPRKESPAPPPRYHPGSATPPFSRASTGLQFPNSIKVSGGGHPGSATLREPFWGKGSLMQAVAFATGGETRARIPPSARRSAGSPETGRARGQHCARLLALSLARWGSCNLSRAKYDVAPSTLALASAAAGDTVVWGHLGDLSLDPCPGWGRGAWGAGVELGGEPEAGLRRDNQHLGRNSSRWFPPRVSQGIEIGPREAEGGSERRVCVRVRTSRQRQLPLAQERQPRGNSSERALKAGKKGLEAKVGF